jgi:phage-related protein
MQPVYYRAADGSEPVDDFIESLPPAHQGVVDNQIERANVLTDPAHPHLPFPHSSQVEGEYRDLRCHYGSAHYRIIYRRSGNLIVLLHALRKRSKKIPRADIEIAKQRWADYKARMEAKPRVPPRAAGHDAPPRRRRA